MIKENKDLINAYDRFFWSGNFSPRNGQPSPEPLELQVQRVVMIVDIVVRGHKQHRSIRGAHKSIGPS